MVVQRGESRLPAGGAAVGVFLEGLREQLVAAGVVAGEFGGEGFAHQARCARDAEGRLPVFAEYPLPGRAIRRVNRWQPR